MPVQPNIGWMTMTKPSLDDLVAHWIRPEIRALSAYHVQDAAGLIKLDAMENPYTWPDELREEWSRLIRDTDVNRYPDPTAAALARELSGSLGVPADMAVLLGNGSDEIIQMIAMALAGSGRTILSVEPGFVMYRMIATFCGMRYVGVPLRPNDFSLDVPAIVEAMDVEQPAVVFLACPNNPTGNLFAHDDVVSIIEAAPGLVVVDEAYAPFTDATFMDLLGRHDNLVVMRTVSKMGLAGLRLGLLAGPAAWLDQFDKVRLPYNVNVLTQVSGAFALRHKAVFDRQTMAIREQRAVVIERLKTLPGVDVFPSEANFVLARVPQGRAGDWFEYVREHGVLIKNLDAVHPLLTDCLRLTVGTPDENEVLLNLLEAVATAG